MAEGLRTKENRMDKQKQALSEASKIYELYSALTELAGSEKKPVRDYAITELVSLAENILDIMGDWDSDSIYDQAEFRKQKRQLTRFIKKWGSEV